jgi:hypothetical protein
MKQNITLTITSLLSILLMTIHMSDDVVRGFEPGGFKNASGILIMVVWLCGTLALDERRSAHIVVLLGSLLGCLLPLAHMRGAGMAGGRLAGTSGLHLFIWTLITLGVTALVSVILSLRGLWTLRRREAR